MRSREKRHRLSTGRRDLPGDLPGVRQHGLIVYLHPGDALTDVSPIEADLTKWKGVIEEHPDQFMWAPTGEDQQVDVRPPGGLASGRLRTRLHWRA